MTTTARRLADLVDPSIAGATTGGDTVITGITADSRAVEPGFLFAALAGAKTDGSRFVMDALAKGAAAILARSGTPIVAADGIPVLRSDEPRQTLAMMAARFYARQPATIVAITGTNGKTSIAEFTRQILAACGHEAASLGTIGIVKPNGAVYGSLTTPDPVTLHRTLSELADEGVTHLVMEASSHGLDQFRLDGVKLTAGAFNNLGRDHLDYHPTVEAYLDAKLRLFRALLQPGQTAVVNMDGPGAAAALAAARERGLAVATTGRDGDTLRLTDVHRDGFQQSLSIAHNGTTTRCRLPLIGEYQAGNALVAAALAMACGEEAAKVLAALSTLKGVKGRLEVAGSARGGIAVVDYAHKPEALAAALDALRPFATGRLISLFGCGGDRDTGKRPIMGGISIEKADITIITDDNPRSELPAAIRAEILANAPGAIEIGDRAAAIRAGVAMLGPGDVLLVAGKGHETGQIVGNSVLPFSDQDEVAKAIAAIDPPPLWTFEDLVAAAGGTADGTPVGPIIGFSIDTRTLLAGEVFVALTDQRDGHAFVAAALAKGAAAALVREDYQRQGPGAFIRVDEPLRALERIGTAARARLSPQARVLAVTGSAGKTGTTAMLRACLAATGDAVHAPEKSYNNHWGVPLTLARMPAQSRYAIFEIGMNHEGEIRPLVKMVRPHLSIITNVLPVHIGNFADGETGVAKAKAEIFEGFEPSGVAILPQDSQHRELLETAATAAGAATVGFGESPEARLRMISLQAVADGSLITARLADGDRQAITWRLGAPGAHLAQNSLAVAAALDLLGLPLPVSLAPLADFRAAAGRGQRQELATPDGSILLIDESYNANPASVAAALAALGTVGRDRFPRRVAVLGDMLELGPEAAQFHLGLKPAVAAAGADLVFCCGPKMKLLYESLPPGQKAAWGPASTDLVDQVAAALRAGDVVMVKGSLGSRMAPIVDAIKKRFAPAQG